jgi:hypothetical protein
MIKKIPDTFFFGIVIAIACFILTYLLIYGIRILIVNYLSNPFAFEEPRIQLLCILINIILFRYVLVNLNRDRTGRGILFSTVLIALIYFFLFSRYHFRMSASPLMAAGLTKDCLYR